jgi:hypothetical protein
MTIAPVRPSGPVAGKKGNAVKDNATSTASEIKLTLETATMETLKSAPIEVVDALAKEYVKKGQKLNEQRDNVKDCTKRFAIVACVLGLRLENAQANNVESRSTTLADFIKRIAGRAPSNHELTLKNSYGTFCLTKNPATVEKDKAESGTPFLSEKDWLGNGNNALELAQKITVAVKGDLSHPAVAQAAGILAENLETKKKGKQLKALLDTLVPSEPMSEERALELLGQIAAVMTAKLGLEMFEAIFASGNVPMCLAHLVDLMKDAPEETQKSHYLAIGNTVEKLDAAIGDKVDQWVGAKVADAQGVQKTEAGKPVETPAPTLEAEPEMAGAAA